MSKVIKAEVINGRYKGEIVRITNVSQDEMGRKFAACFLANGTRANIVTSDLKLIEEKTAEPEITGPKTSMPFVSGSTGSRTMTHTKNMSKPRMTNKVSAKCENCGCDVSEKNSLCDECQSDP